MKKKSKKIAIISSSPLMMMLALHFKLKGENVTIFDSSSFKGGAWSWFGEYLNKYKIYVPKYTNIINPYNEKEVKYIKKMNKCLQKKFKVKVKRTNQKFSINYDFKEKFSYDFSKFYEKALNELNFVQDFIYKLETLSNKKVKLNNSILFDKVYLPSFSGVKKIKINNRKIFIPKCKEIVSEHVAIIARKFKLKNFHYSQFFDNSFDRVKIEKSNKFYTLTARLGHSIKGTKVKKIRKDYLDKFANKKDIIDVKLSKFHNYYRNKEQLKDLKNAISGSNIKYVDTTQFMCGFFSLRKILNTTKI